MFPEIVIGPIAVIAGVLLILLRRDVPKIIHSGLELFFGAPVADDAVRPRAATHVMVVGIASMLMGGFITVTAFIPS